MNICFRKHWNKWRCYFLSYASCWVRLFCSIVHLATTWWSTSVLGIKSNAASLNTATEQREAVHARKTEWQVNSSWTPGFDIRVVHVLDFVMNKVLLRLFFSQFFGFFPVSIISSLLHIHLCGIWRKDRKPFSGWNSKQTQKKR